MIALVEPCEKYLQSYIEAYDEYKQNDVRTYAFDDARAYNIFEKYDNYRHERNLKPNRVGSDYYWLVDEERNYFIGEISIRHRLTDDLKRYGGHIGYGIRFSEWFFRMEERIRNFDASLGVRKGKKYRDKHRFNYLR